MQIVSTFVYKNKWFDFCDTRSRVAANFRFPRGVTIDPNGNLYIVDTRSYTIRKIDAAGSISFFAGVPGQRGKNDGYCLRAYFNNPNDITIDNLGNIYISDGEVIRMINQSGIVTTLAEPRFFNADGIVFDRSGNQYVVDSMRHSLHKISPNKEVTILAGIVGVSGMEDSVPLSAQYFSLFPQLDSLRRESLFQKLLTDCCSICLQDFILDDPDIKILPCCHNPIHFQCTIIMGLQFQCPLCRAMNISLI